MSREPDEQELLGLYNEIGVDATEELTIMDFLRLAKALNRSQHCATFNLMKVLPNKLRDVLRCFHLAEEYIMNASAADLPQLVADYLEVKCTTDLREDLPGGATVGNVRQLMEYATKKAAVDRRVAASYR